MLTDHHAKSNPPESRTSTSRNTLAPGTNKQDPQACHLKVALATKLSTLSMSTTSRLPTLKRMTAREWFRKELLTAQKTAPLTVKFPSSGGNNRNQMVTPTTTMSFLQITRLIPSFTRAPQWHGDSTPLSLSGSCQETLTHQRKTLSPGSKRPATSATMSLSSRELIREISATISELIIESLKIKNMKSFALASLIGATAFAARETCQV